VPPPVPRAEIDVDLLEAVPGGAVLVIDGALEEAHRHHGALGDHAPLADLGPVAHHSAHAHHGVVADALHVVHYAAVTQGYPGADGAGLTGAGVDDAVVLHGAAVAEDDGAVVAAQTGAGPHPAVAAEDDVAEHVGRRVHPGAFPEAGDLAFEAADGHGGNTTASAELLETSERRHLTASESRRT